MFKRRKVTAEPKKTSLLVSVADSGPENHSNSVEGSALEPSVKIGIWKPGRIGLVQRKGRGHGIVFTEEDALSHEKNADDEGDGGLAGPLGARHLAQGTISSSAKSTFSQAVKPNTAEKHLQSFLEREIENYKRLRMETERAKLDLDGHDEQLSGEGTNTAAAARDVESETEAETEKQKLERLKEQLEKEDAVSEMLSTIPEVDLGFESRVKTIKATEQAKWQRINELHGAHKKTPEGLHSSFRTGKHRFKTTPVSKHSHAGGDAKPNANAGGRPVSKRADTALFNQCMKRMLGKDQR